MEGGGWIVEGGVVGNQVMKQFMVACPVSSNLLPSPCQTAREMRTGYGSLSEGRGNLIFKFFFGRMPRAAPPPAEVDSSC